MNDQNKTDKKWLIIILLILFLFLGNVFLVYKVMHQSEKFDNYENAIKALNDSVHVMVKNGKTYFAQKAPEMNLNDLTNSEYFKTLSTSQQQFYLDLKNIKGLLSATQASLNKQDIVLAQLALAQSGGQIVHGDSIEFKVGQVLKFNETDTTKKLQWKADVTLKNPIDFKFDYNYKFKIMTTFERQKDKSILVKYNMDDPDLKVNSMQNFTIPKEEKRTWLGRWIEKNKRPLQIAGGSILFLGGGYVGYTLAK